jgi:hypothetical protein
VHAPEPTAAPKPAPAPAPAPAAAQPAAAAVSPEQAALEASDPAHKAARKFARLVVSEIKLYDPELVKQGVAAGNLYGKLQDQIDQAIVLYDKRVPEEVRTKFDYLHDELVRQLAGGDASKIGPAYPRRTAH